MLAPEVTKGRCLLSGAAACLNSKNGSADKILLSAYGRNPCTVKLLLKTVEDTGDAAMECQKTFLVWKKREDSQAHGETSPPMVTLLPVFQGFQAWWGPVEVMQRTQVFL